MKLKLTVLFAALLFALALFAGCGSADTNAGDDKSTAEAASQADTGDSGAENSVPADYTETDLPFVPKDKTDNESSNAQAAQTQSDGQTTSGRDPYEGAGY